MRLADITGLTLSGALHGLLLLSMFGEGSSSTNPAPSPAPSLVSVEAVRVEPPLRVTTSETSRITERTVPEKALEISPTESDPSSKHGQSWLGSEPRLADGDEEQAGEEIASSTSSPTSPVAEPARPETATASASPKPVTKSLASSAPTVSDTAVKAVDLVLEPGDPQIFFEAAKDLGIRLLVFRAGGSPKWMLLIDPATPNKATRLAGLPKGAFSKRAHDLTPSAYFRDLRDQVLRQHALPTTNTVIVAAIPAGTDRMFFDAERAFLSSQGAATHQIRRLQGRLVKEGRRWVLRLRRSW